MEPTRTNLIDSYGRTIRYLRISITDRCNLRCRYCMPEEGIEWLPHDGILRYEEILRVIGICKRMGIDKVRITGGEPLIRKGILSFVKSINGIEGIKDLSLTTNGVLLSVFAEELKEAGISRLNISLDTLVRKKFEYITRSDTFDRVMEGIEKAKALDFGIKINVVAIAGFNDDEVNDFARLTLNNDLEIRFIELMPMGCAARFGNGRVFRANELKCMVESEFGLLEPTKTGTGPARVYKVNGAKGRIGFIDPMTEHTFCRRCNRIRLTSSGQLRLCLFSSEGTDLLTPIRMGADDEELSQIIWNSVQLKPKEGVHISGAKGNMNRIGG